MQDVGFAALQIIPSFKGLDSQLEAGTSKAMLAAGQRGGARFGDAAGRTAGQRFGRMFATTAKAGLVGVGALGALAFKVGKDSVGLASDLNESLNAVNVTYEDQAKAVKKLGREAATSLGLSNTEFNGLAVQFSGFAEQIAGGEGPKVIGVLDDLTTRGADFASVMNLEVNEALGLFQSGLAGETEPLRRFGLDLSAAAVESHAYATGIADVGDKLTESEKVQARYSLMMKQTSKAQGDFANTSDSLANRQRVLAARWDDARAKLGNGLLPIVEDATGFLLDKGIPAFEDFSDWFVDKGAPAIGDFLDEMKPVAKDLLPEVADALKTVGGFLKDAAGYADDLVGAFNDMPEWAKTALVGGGAAALTAKKLGVTSLLGKAGSSLTSRATPVPVFVTNPGFSNVPGTPDAPGGGKSKWLPLLTGTAATTAVAGAAAFAGTAGIFKLQEKVAPKAYDKGIVGTPNFGTGLANAEGDILNFDDDEKAVVRWSTMTQSEVAKVKALMGTLPSKVQTAFITQGIPQSLGEAMDLKRQYELTPNQVRTLFQVMGLSSAEVALERARQKLEALDGKSYSARMDVLTVYSTVGNATDAFPNKATREADGGLIRGPGGPRGDKIPAWLSDREFVVNAASTAKYLPLLRRINADRFANGGLVGPAGPGGSMRLNLGELRVRGTLDTPWGPAQIEGMARDAARDEIDADRRFDAMRTGSAR